MLIFLSNSFDEKRWVCCRNKQKEPKQAKIYISTWTRRTRTRTPRTHARTHETADATDTEAGAPGRSSTPLAEPLSVSGALRNLASAQSAAYAAQSAAHANVSAAYAALAAALASDQNGAARGDTRGSLLESAILLAANAAPSVPLHSSLPLHSSFPMHPSFPPQPPHSSIPRPARSTPQLPAESQRNAPRTAESQRTLVQWYTGSTTVRKKGSAPRVIPAVGPPKPVGPPKHECRYKSKGCQMSSDHAPAVASHEKGCSFKPQGSVVATMKTPFCLDAQIRRREQLNELTEQLESAVPEEAQGSCHWVYSSVPEALTMVQCTDDKTIKEWHNESFQVRQAELGICPRTTVTSDVSTFGHVHDHISLTTEERVKAYRSELVMRECGEFSEAEIAEALRTDKENAKREIATFGRTPKPDGRKANHTGGKVHRKRYPASVKSAILDEVDAALQRTPTGAYAHKRMPRGHVHQCAHMHTHMCAQVHRH